MFAVVIAAARYGIRTRRGRRLLMLGGLHAVRLARSRRARRAYARTWRIARRRTRPRPLR